MSKFTFGSDPEFMLEKDGNLYSSINIVKGSKDARISKNGHEFYYDNVMAECGIKPGKTKKEVLANFKEALQIYAGLVKPYKLLARASGDYPEQELKNKMARVAVVILKCVHMKLLMYNLQ